VVRGLLTRLPFEVARKLEFLPFHEFVHEAQIGLDDDVETSGADEEIGAGEGEGGSSDDFGDADACGTAYSDAAVD